MQKLRSAIQRSPAGSPGGGSVRSDTESDIPSATSQGSNDVEISSNTIRSKSGRIEEVAQSEREQTVEEEVQEEAVEEEVQEETAEEEVHRPVRREVEILSEDEGPEVRRITTGTSITYERGGSHPSVIRAATSSIDVTVVPVVHL